MIGRKLHVWPTLAPSVHLRRPAREMPFPLGRAGTRLFARARHGLWHGLATMSLHPGDEVLAPAYHHGSEIEALVRRGLRCRFYEALDGLAPDEAELERLLGPRVRALKIVHYLGFPQQAEKWRRWCDERGLVLIEDAAQAWLATVDGRPAGSFGHIAIFCLYKTYGLPDGAALACSGGVAPAGRGTVGVGGLLRQHRAWAAQRWPASRAGGPSVARPAWDPARSFALGNPESAPSLATTALLARAASVDAAAARREHYAFLLERLGDLVPSPFDVLPAGASPFAFPVTIGASKAEALSALDRAGVAALDLWSRPHPVLPAAKFPGAAQRRAHTLGLPVHQELGRRELERIVRAVTAHRGLLAGGAAPNRPASQEETPGLVPSPPRH